MNGIGTNIKRVFISHSSKDKAFGDAVVRLLRGLGLTQGQIVYTSNPQYGIPPGKNIFEYLRDQLNNDTYMIYMLSDNYYNSIFCLNEMGAAWVRQADALMLLLPGFDTNCPKFQNGVPTPWNMAAKLDDDVQMRQVAAKILQTFQLDPMNVNIQNAYDVYLHEIEELKKMPSVQLAVQLAQTERELHSKPDEARLHTHKGRLLYDVDREKYPEAIQSVMYAIYLNPDYPDAYHRLVQIAGVQGDHPRSLRIAEEAVRRFPKNPHSYGCYGYALGNSGRHEEAVEALSKAIQIGPDQWFYFLRGCNYQDLGKLDEALLDFWTIYQQYDPDYVDTAERIKVICKKIGIKKMFKEADKLNKQIHAAQESGVDEDEQSLVEEAQKYFGCILLADPNNKEALRECGGLYFSIREFDTALVYWTRLLELEKRCYHYYLCAVANKAISDLPETRRLQSLGLELPDDGWHERLKNLI